MKNTTKFGMIVVFATMLVFSLSIAFAGNENATAAKNNTTNVTKNMTNVTTNMTNVTTPFAEAKGMLRPVPMFAINNTTNKTYPTNETKLMVALTKRNSM